ncbi:MAG: hypothetical protein RBR22_12865 [Desulfuromonas sp.]|nr:hypothetical protein [Desulfuromonas sp.]
MDTATRNSFLQQLSHWATKHIITGSSPFRKAQVRPRIITSSAEQQPDLVFWINKDSFVSGGFILCVDNDDFDLTSAQACAQALGLSYFASWSAQKITIWKTSARTPHLEMPAPNSAATTITNPFEDALIELMDQFRTLAVLGTRPPQELSYWHLTNLFLATTTKAQTALTKHLRSQPGLHNKYLPTAQSRAQNKIHLCIARMLVLTYFERIPHNLQPENLDSALKYLINELGPGHCPCLAIQPGEADLDEKSAIALHHLLHRLGQVAVFHDAERARKLLEQLLIHSAPYANAPEHVPCQDSDIYLYCNNLAKPSGGTDTTIEVDTRARAGIKYLIRQLSKLDNSAIQLHSIFALSADKTPRTITGFLYNNQRPDIKHRNNWLKNIKLAWSGAIVDIPRTTPTWGYELIYLLGILAPQGRLNLSVPTELFSSNFSTMLVEIIQAHCTLHTISQGQDSTINFNATKEHDIMVQTKLSGDQQRSIAWSQLSTADPEFFALALNLKEPLFQLITQGKLKFIANQTDWNQAGIELYIKSTLAQALRQHLIPASTSNWQPRIPLPSAALLEDLAIKVATTARPAETLKTIDKIIKQQLNLSAAEPAIAPRNKKATLTVQQNSKTVTSELRQKLINIAELTGVPQFPEQYLFDHYKPELVSYPQATQPWQITSEFMGTFQLSPNSLEENKPTLNVDNEYLACAIVLASWGELTVKLPVDLAIVEKIVKRYLGDLSELHRSIWSTAHAAIPRHETANRLVNKSWKTLGLPPWKTVDEFRARFLIP